MEVSYSAAAIIAVVPKAADRLHLSSPKGGNNVMDVLMGQDTVKGLHTVVESEQ